MFDTFLKKTEDCSFFCIAFSANILYNVLCFSLIFLFLHQCQSKVIYVKGLFTPFYTINKNFKTAFRKKQHFFLFLFKKNQNFKALC